MSAIDPIFLFYAEFEEVRRIQEYPDLINRFNGVLIKIEGKKGLDLSDELELKKIITVYWKRCISELCEKIMLKINNRFLRGQLFFEDIKDVNKSKSLSEGDLELGDYRDIFFDLNDIEKRVDEKRYAERFAVYIAAIFLIIGFILGLLTNSLR